MDIIEALLGGVIASQTGRPTRERGKASRWKVRGSGGFPLVPLCVTRTEVEQVRFGRAREVAPTHVPICSHGAGLGLESLGPHRGRKSFNRGPRHDHFDVASPFLKRSAWG